MIHHVIPDNATYANVVIIINCDVPSPSYIEKFKEEYSKERSNLNMVLYMKEQLKEILDENCAAGK